MELPTFDTGTKKFKKRELSMPVYRKDEIRDRRKEIEEEILKQYIKRL